MVSVVGTKVFLIFVEDKPLWGELKSYGRDGGGRGGGGEGGVIL